jgi:putative SOS response-associated peptidase YedK
MCGRFTLHVPTPRVTEYFDLASCPEFSPRYNIAPTSNVLVIRHRPDVGRVGRMVAYPVGMAVNRASEERNTLIAPMQDK